MATLQGGEDEPRIAARRRVLKAAQIVYDGGQTVIDCMIRNISETGAKIDTEIALALPGSFWVILPDGVRRPSEVVWQKGQLLGVRFTDAGAARQEAGQPVGKAALIARITEIENQLAALRAEIVASLAD